MTTDGDTKKRERLELAGDGALTTAATFAVLTAIVLLVAQGVGNREVPVALQILSAAAMLLGGVGGPVIAWLIHDRRISLPAVVGAILGAPAAGAVFFVFVALSTAIGWAISPLWDAEYAGPLAGAILVTVAFFVLVIWLVTDAVRDLAPSRRTHARLDTVRLIAAGLVAAFSAAVMVLAFAPGNAEIAEALAFMLLGAVSGGLAVTFADLATRLLVPKPQQSAGVPEL
jgi:hypothetical protein